MALKQAHLGVVALLLGQLLVKRLDQPQNPGGEPGLSDSIGIRFHFASV
jgi:hypothetical protein